LHSELAQYIHELRRPSFETEQFDKLTIKEKKKIVKKQKLYASKLGRSIITGKHDKLKLKDRTGIGKTVSTDFKKLRSALEAMKLQLWGGNKDGLISALSWEAENTPPEAARGRGKDSVPKKPINAINALAGTSGDKVISLVILAHDTSAADVRDLEKDIKTYAEHAKTKGIAIVYMTMTDLYKFRVGSAP